ncbi:MAG: hypothetical protein QOD61_338, partial [Solirubrobacteraceae bacterium]|nr:hypothetical protein [Solirubrobacteraceae bacterium]
KVAEFGGGPSQNGHSANGGRSATEAALEPVRGVLAKAGEKRKPLALGAGGTLAGGLVVTGLLVRRSRRRSRARELKRQARRIRKRLPG